jgi:hypothetical protein
MLYPTNNPVVNDLCKFFYDRLPAAICKPIPAYGDIPSLAEDWWVEKKIQDGVIVPGVNDNEQGLRNIYRWGRYVAIEKHGDLLNIDYHKELLLHQVTELIPVLFLMAGNIQQEQRTTASQN